MKDKSWLTAIHRTKASLPARRLKKLELIKGRVLDYGCGRGADVKFLRASGYDPNQPKFKTRPTGFYDTILCTYVLNVLPESKRRKVIDNILSLLTLNGTAYLTVRRDVPDGWTRTRKGTDQWWVAYDLPFVVSNSSYCIYKTGRWL